MSIYSCPHRTIDQWRCTKCLVYLHSHIFMSTTTHSSRMKANFSKNCHSKQVADRSIGDYQNYFIEGSIFDHNENRHEILHRRVYSRARIPLNFTLMSMWLSRDIILVTSNRSRSNTAEYRTNEKTTQIAEIYPASQWDFQRDILIRFRRSSIPLLLMLLRHLK